jgi:hypothetical protein
VSNGISLKDFTKAFEYTKTQSGPVKPARTTSVKMMKGTLGPVGDQTKQDWDHRTYENKSLLQKKNYLSLKDIAVKIMAESTSSTSYSPMRLNLSGMDMDKTSINGEFVCDGEPVTMNLRYPNTKGNISVELALDDGNSTLYTVPLESDQFKGNFAQSIRQTARNLITKVSDEERNNMMNGVGMVKMPGDNFNDTLGLAAGDTNNITRYEAVDWKLNKLLDICNQAEAQFEAEDFNAEDFSLPGGDAGGDMGGGLGGGDMGGAPADGTEQPQDAGDVNGVNGGNGKGDETLEFREFCIPSDPDNGSGLSQAAWDNMAQIVSDAINYVNDNQAGGVKPSATEWYEGFPGVKNMIPDEILDQFLSFDDYKALDTTLPIKGLRQFAHALEGGKVDVTKFKTDLGKWFPEVYNTDGTAMHDVAKETAAMTFPQDDNTGVGQGLDQSAPVDFGGIGEMGDMMDNAQSMVGNGMDDGMDDNLDAGIDMSEDGSNSEEPGKDKTEMAIDSLDNLF